MPERKFLDFNKNRKFG